MILNDLEVRHSSLSNALWAPNATLTSLVSDIERSSETVRRMRGPESFMCKAAVLVSKQHAIKALQVSPRKSNTTVASGLCNLDLIRGGQTRFSESRLIWDRTKRWIFVNTIDCIIRSGTTRLQFIAPTVLFIIIADVLPLFSTLYLRYILPLFLAEALYGSSFVVMISLPTASQASAGPF